MMRRIQNLMRREAQREASTRAKPRRATVSAYDPDAYAAKVLIQPEGFETGFLPIASSWVGRGWGMFCPPTPGDEVDVHFQEDSKNAAYISLRFFGNQARPQSVPSGEFWLLHASGSLFKFTNDGKVIWGDRSGSFFTLEADGTATLGASLNVQGDIVATGSISDQNGTNGTVQHIRDVYDIHTHGGSVVPDQQL